MKLEFIMNKQKLKNLEKNVYIKHYKRQMNNMIEEHFTQKLPLKKNSWQER